MPQMWIYNNCKWRWCCQQLWLMIIIKRIYMTIMTIKVMKRRKRKKKKGLWRAKCRAKTPTLGAEHKSYKVSKSCVSMNGIIQETKKEVTQLYDYGTEKETTQLWIWRISASPLMRLGQKCIEEGDVLRSSIRLGELSLGGTSIW